MPIIHNISLKYNRIAHKPEVFWLGSTHPKNNLAHTYMMLNLPMICLAPKLPPSTSFYKILNTWSCVKAGNLHTQPIFKTNWISLNSNARDGFSSFTFIISCVFSRHKGSLFPTVHRHCLPHLPAHSTWAQPRDFVSLLQNHWCKHTKQEPTKYL